MPTSLADLRRFAVARSLFAPASLGQALECLGFVQADPIRAPARAQDLTLRHRVAGYRAGDLERLYPTLAVEEDTFINYGFVTRTVHRLMHPRSGIGAASATERRRMREVLEFIGERGTVHPRDVDRHFAHGRVTNYWGGTSNATTHLLDLMHYRGLLRIAGRQDGIRTYTLLDGVVSPSDASERAARLDQLIDVLVRKYAPLTGRGLSIVVRRLRYAAPQLRTGFDKALVRAKERLGRARVDGTDWFWPAEESPEDAQVPDVVRLLTPFDPVVWDRERFEQIWGWQYRFEAYTPPAKRIRGYYALPLLWRDRVVGWANVSVKDETLRSDVGYVRGRAPRERGFRVALDEEFERLGEFLSIPGGGDRTGRRG